ncbi:hypothetical protein Mame01_53570 [Microbispora amethystogenes]|nr:hypothetical protein Mame01_53570 [Microbispora amethystogenes]
MLPIEHNKLGLGLVPPQPSEVGGVEVGLIQHHPLDLIGGARTMLLPESLVNFKDRRILKAREAGRPIVPEGQ